MSSKCICFLLHTGCLFIVMMSHYIEDLGGFCQWDDTSWGIAYGVPIIFCTILSLPLCVYLYCVVLKSWKNVRECSDLSAKIKLTLIFEGLQANCRLATNLLILSVVPAIFGFLYPMLKSLLPAVAGDDFSESPYLIYVCGTTIHWYTINNCTLCPVWL